MVKAEQLPPDQWPIGDPPTNPDVPPSKPFDDDDEEEDENDFRSA